MKKITLVLGLLIIAATGVFAQKSKVNTASTATAATQASAQKSGTGAASLAAGTQIAAQLQNSLDVRNAKVGDQVVLKATQAVKQNGQVVVQKGAKLIGRVTEVQQKAKGQATSKLGVVFNTLQQGGNSLPINAVITSITQAQAAASLSSGDDLMASGSGSGMSSTSATTSSRSSSSGNGGLLGGVGNAVGGVTNTVGNTVGGVTSTAGQTLGSTTSAVGGTLSGLQISQSTNASASGGSTLSLTGGNLKLDKGATFNMNVNSSSSAKIN